MDAEAVPPCELCISWSFGCALKSLNNKEQKAFGPPYCLIKLACMVASTLYHHFRLSNLKPHMVSREIPCFTSRCSSMQHSREIMYVKAVLVMNPKTSSKKKSESAVLKGPVRNLGELPVDNQMSSGPTS